VAIDNRRKHFHTVSPRLETVTVAASASKAIPGEIAPFLQAFGQLPSTD